MQENKTKSIGRTARMRGVGGLVAGLRSRSQGNSFWDGFVNHISENWSQELAIGMAVALVTFGVSWAVQAMKQVGPHCFIAGTLVACLSADGEEIHKRIEEIEIGDRVLAYDEETGEQGYKPVARLFRNQTKEWYHVFIGGEEIECTGEHPFYVEGKGFIPAKELKSGDKCLLSTGEDVTIEKVELEALTEAETTYNFEVADFHTYYVTDKDVLVHNKCFDIQTGDTKDFSIYNSRRAAYRAARRDAGVLHQRPTEVGLARNRQEHMIPGKTYTFGNKQILWHSAGHPEYGMTRHFNYNGWHYFY